MLLAIAPKAKKTLPRLLLVGVVICTMLPDIAWARAGGGGSNYGSRGGRTYSAPRSSGTPYRAQPIQRSITPQAAPRSNFSNNQSQQSYGAAGAAQQSGGFFGGNAGGNAFAPQQRSGFSPFWGGLAGSFIGMGAANMLFGQSSSHAAPNPNQAYPAGGAPMNQGGDPNMANNTANTMAYNQGQQSGGMLQWLLLGGLGWLAWRWFKRRGGMNAFTQNGMQNGRNAAPNPFASNITPPLASMALDNEHTNHDDAPLTLLPSDEALFRQRVTQIQLAWGQGDLNKLRAYITPELYTYFSEALTSDASRSLSNKVEQVVVDAVKLVEAWTEYTMDYATTQVSWHALDYKVRLDREPNAADYVAEGSATMPVSVTEIWTFARAQQGNWLLSAIQQVATA